MLNRLRCRIAGALALTALAAGGGTIGARAQTNEELGALNKQVVGAGEGDAELPSPARASVFPVATTFFHSSLPAVETHIRTRSAPGSFPTELER